MIIVHFEVYVMEGRGWMLHARFPRLERDEAVREAKELESTLGVRTKVLRETYNTDTNVFDEAEVYLSGHNVQVKKIAAAGRGAAGGGGRAGGRERDSGKGGNAARTAAARRAAKARTSGPSMGAGAAILRLTVILLVASGLGLGALRMVPSAVVFLYDYGYRVTPDEYGQLLMVVFGLVFLMTAVPLGLRFMPRNANIQFNRSTSVAAPPPRPQPSEAVKKSLNKLAKKAEAEMIPETWGDDPELVNAAEAIRTAICLLAGGTLVSAQDMLHIRHHGMADHRREQAEAALLRRYTWWRWEVARRGWVIGSLVACIAGDAVPSDPAKLREALLMFARAPRHVA